MRYRPIVLLTMLFFLIVMSSAAQSNQVVDSLLTRKEVPHDEVAYMILVGGGLLSEDASLTDAFTMAETKGWLDENATPESLISIQNFSLLAMQGFQLKGGVGWNLFHSRRYAYKELIALGIVNASGGPNRVPSGEEALRMISALAERKGSEQ